MLHATGFFSFREREYPTIGCDSYDAMPDDLDDPDAYPIEPEESDPELAETTAASSDGLVAGEGAPAASTEPSNADAAAPSESPVVATIETSEPSAEGSSLAKTEGSAVSPEGSDPKTEGEPGTDGGETEAARAKKIEATA